jgi:hypothetical protein
MTERGSPKHADPNVPVSFSAPTKSKTDENEADISHRETDGFASLVISH